MKRPSLPDILLAGVILATLAWGSRMAYLAERGGASASSSPFLPVTSEPRATVEHWADRIDAVGTEDAYRELKASYASADFTTQHLMGHMFGDLLYEKAGPRGVLICDDSFGFGCYHNFLSMALASRGPAAVEELDAVCREKGASGAATCQHGIGHGLVEYLGYGEVELAAALRACEGTERIGWYSGCAWGVFMASNMRVVTGDEGVSLELRRFDPGHPYEPCPGAPAKHRSVCYGQLAFWWEKTIGDPARIADLCMAIPDRSHREFCVFGAGMIGATLSDYDPERSLAKCGKMPGGGMELLCRAGAVASFRSFPEKRHLAEDICADLSEEERQDCLSLKPLSYP